MKLVNQTVQLQSQDENNTVDPLQWTYVSFLGNKASANALDNPFKVNQWPV